MQWWDEDDRADPNWEMNWHTGIAIGLLCVVLFAIIVGVVTNMAL